jgi:putative ABC transport system permease protein
MLKIHLFFLRIACLALPASFRQDYQGEIILIFRGELLGRSGAGVIRAWLSVLPDLIETAIREHLELLKSDACHWLRFVRQRKAFSAGLIGNFAASIALTSAMFSVTHALLLRSLPYHDPDSIVSLENFPSALAQSNPGTVRDWLKTQEVFDDLAYYSPWDGNLDGGDNFFRVKAASVSGSFFGVFGQSVLLGSDFDESRGDFAVLSEPVWRDVFGGDPTIVGRTIRVNGEQLRVNGVMRPGFRFPESTQIWTYTRGDEIFLKLLEEQQAVSTFVVARLNKGATRSQGASAAMALSLALVGEEAREYPKAVVPLQAALTADIRRPVLFLTLAAGMLLLLGCASAAGLLIARNAQRREDVSIRFALGARPGIIRRQATVEGILFSLCGGVFGVWAAFLLVRLIPSGAVPTGMIDVSLDQSVLGVCVITALCSGALTGWVAGWNAARAHGAPSKSRTSGDNADVTRFGRWLLCGQVAMTTALLVWAGLQGKNLYGLMRADPGFDTQALAAATISFKGSPYKSSDVRRQLIAQWQHGIEAAIPGAMFAVTSKLPLRRDSAALVSVQLEGASTAISSRYRTISENYVATAGGVIVAGQDFGATSFPASSPVALVNEQFATRLGLSAQELIGRRVLTPSGSQRKSRQIIGVYRRESSAALSMDSRPEISYPLAESPPEFLSLLVRVRSDPIGAVPPLQKAIRDEAPHATVFDVQPMSEYVAESLTMHRLYALILGTFATLSTATSIAGLISVALFYMSSRRQGLGIRLALGATRLQLMSLVARQGIPLLFAGVLAGAALACAGSSGIAALLVDVRPLDPAVHLTVAITFLLAGILAMLACSLRVTRLDPNVTLRG